MRWIVLVSCAALVACTNENQDRAAQKAPPAPTAKPAATTPPAPPPVAKPAPLTAREGGPSQLQCEHYADRVLSAVVEAKTPPGTSEQDKQRALVALQPERPNHVGFCLAALEVKEVECVVASADFAALAACERWRRQVPDDMKGRTEVNEADCERFFVRYKQYMVETGVPPERVDQDKEQLVRTCLEKATPGTLACFITARSYEEAKRCP